MKNIKEFILESYSDSTFIKKLKQFGELTEDNLKEILGDDYKLNYPTEDGDKHITSLYINRGKLYACFYNEKRKTDFETEAFLDYFTPEDAIDKIYDYIK